jgi:phosphomevalonate kinase
MHVRPWKDGEAISVEKSLLPICASRYSGRMRHLSLTAAILLAFSLPSMASDLEQEYAQVRKIALKDPKVQEAFERADERLDEKILQIDPALKPVVDREKRKSAAAPAEAQGVKVKHHAAASPTPGARQGEHVVAKGETLSSIAAQYKVTVSALEKTNHITDERKLKVGQKLVIPGAGGGEAHQSTEAKPEEDGGMWERLKNSL